LFTSLTEEEAVEVLESNAVKRESERRSGRGT